MGYYRAGFTEIVGVDIKPQSRYPFTFIQADAMTYPLEGFDAIHASPPCQGYSIMLNLPWLRGREYPMLISPIRARLKAAGVAYVIENVKGARYKPTNPDGLQAGWLCGGMFGLPIYRHRYFETNFYWQMPGHPMHRGAVRRGSMFGSRQRDQVVRKTGHKYGFDRPEAAVGHAAVGGMSARNALGVPWMSRDEATQAIPPAYTEHIGRQLLPILDVVDFKADAPLLAQ